MRLWLVLTRLGFVVVYLEPPEPVPDAGQLSWPLDFLWSFGPRDVKALGFRTRLTVDVPVQVTLSLTDAGHGLHFRRRPDGDVELQDGSRPGMTFCRWMLRKLRCDELPASVPVWVVYP